MTSVYRPFGRGFFYSDRLSVLFFSPTHAAGQTEGRGDGGENRDYHVDNYFPSFFLVFGTHNKLFLKGSPPFYGWNDKALE